MGIEVAQGRPKLTMNLGGRTTGTVQLDSAVNDHQWRELAVQRRGKRATLRISKPGTDEAAEEKARENTKNSKKTMTNCRVWIWRGQNLC
jgi:hypothetical protein